MATTPARRAPVVLSPGLVLRRLRRAPWTALGAAFMVTLCTSIRDYDTSQSLTALICTGAGLAAGASVTLATAGRLPRRILRTASLVGILIGVAAAVAAVVAGLIEVDGPAMDIVMNASLGLFAASLMAHNLSAPLAGPPQRARLVL